MVGACINTRKNDFSSRPDCKYDGGSVLNGSTETCAAVFNSSTPTCTNNPVKTMLSVVVAKLTCLIKYAEASKDTFRSLSDIGLGNRFDEGDICNTGLQVREMLCIDGIHLSPSLPL